MLKIKKLDKIMDTKSSRFEPYFLNTSGQDTTRIANLNALQDQIK